MNTASKTGQGRARAATAPAAVLAAGLLLAACSGGSAPARTAGGGARAGRPAHSSTSTPATWAPGVTAAEAAAGTSTGTDQAGITPWLTPVASPGPTAARSPGCAALHDPGWRAECVRVDTGRAVLTGVVESRSSAGQPPVWRAVVWREQGQQEVETLAAGDPGVPLWEWAAVRSADLLGNGHRELVFGFVGAGSGAILDLDVVGADGRDLLGSQMAVDHGAATISGRRILTYHPVYRDAEPNCCPTGGAARDTVELRSGTWVVTGSEPVAPLGPGHPDFPDDFGPPRLR